MFFNANSNNEPMTNLKQLPLVISLLFFSLISMAQQDKPDCKDAEPAYLGRMNGFYLSNCQTSEYKEHEFFYRAIGGKSVRLKKAGEYRRLMYEKDKSASRNVSGDQIRANYANAILKIKGKSLSENNTFFSFIVNGNEVFLQVENAVDSDDKGYDIFMIEVKAMKQEIEFSIKEGIEKDGKIALYGILFDTGKSEIKPESAETLKQITDYLNANPAVRIIVAGHTDNTGTYTGNMTLSKARAESIKTYLSGTGKISASRMIAEGVGQVCPVSSNDTEEGRKLNRRIEIVKQ
jgi:outer membrane protein OmpA-like peptidoglycan-associated protein